MKALTTLTYMTSFMVELTDPVFILNSVNIRVDKSTQVNLVDGVYESSISDLGEQVHYQMKIFANKVSFEAGAEGLPYKDVNEINTWTFRMTEPEYDGMTVEQAAYHHFKTYVMPDVTFTESTLTLPPILN